MNGKRGPLSTPIWPAGRVRCTPNAPFAWDLLGHIDPTPYASADTGFPNMFVRADLDTLRIAPWAPRTALCLFDAFIGPDGPTHPLDPRAILRRAVARLEATGYVAWTASELEFYLCDERWQRIYADTRCWSMERGAELEPVLGIARELEPQRVTDGDAYQDPDLEVLPTSLGMAAQLFERSPFCKGLYGETFVETFTILARREQAAFLHHVTDWERDRYLAQA